MTVKKSAGTKPDATKAARAPKKPASQIAWTLPFAMLMLVLAAGALWMAARESSNRTQAATPASTGAVMTPDVSAAKAPKPAAAPATPAPAPAASAAKEPPASITGCLARGDRGFMLKDTEGAAAPKSRSWKSGFLKRSASSVMLNDSGNASHLADHVGQRVSVTGPLSDREMRVVSVRKLAASCE